MPDPSAQPLKTRFLVGVSSTTLASVFPQIVTLVGLMLVLRWVDQENFGVYALLAVLVQFFNIISEFGIGSSVMRNIQAVDDADERENMIVSVLSTVFLFSLVAGAVALVSRPLILRLYDYSLLGEVLWYLPGMLLLTALNGIMQRLLQAVYAYRMLMVVKIGGTLLRFGLLVLLVKGMGQGIRGIIHADLVSLLATYVVALFGLPIRPRLHVDWPLVRRLLGFGFPLYLNALLSYVFGKVDILMIGNMTNATYVAAVDVAKRIPNNLNVILSTSFMSVFYPNISALVTRQQPEKARRLVDMSMRLVSFAVYLLTVGFLMLQDEIVLLLFSRDYLFVGPAVTMFMLALSIGVASNIMGTTLVASGFTQVPVRVNLLVVILNVVGNLVLIPRYGFLGAAAATLVSATVALPLNHWTLHRRVFPADAWGYMAPLLLALAFWAGRHWLPIEPLLARIGMIGLYPALCLALMKPLRADVREVLNHGRSMLGRSTTQDDA